jgi:hypothetical protein
LKKISHLSESTPDDNAIQSGNGANQEAAIKGLAQAQTRMYVELERVGYAINNLSAKIDSHSAHDHSVPREENSMSNISKEELDAKLGRNKAEVEAIASGMKTEMANFRTSYTEAFKDISITLNSINVKADATEKRLTQSQWIISLVISISAVTLSAVIFFSNKPSSRIPQQPPSVVVNTSSQERSTEPLNTKPDNSAGTKAPATK